jgi:hypothetical protein
MSVHIANSDKNTLYVGIIIRTLYNIEDTTEMVYKHLFHSVVCNKRLDITK